MKIMIKFKKIKNGEMRQRIQEGFLEVCGNCLERLRNEGTVKAEEEYSFFVEVMTNELVDFHKGFECAITQLVKLLYRLINYHLESEKSCSYCETFQIHHFYLFKIVDFFLRKMVNLKSFTVRT